MSICNGLIPKQTYSQHNRSTLGTLPYLICLNLCFEMAGSLACLYFLLPQSGHYTHTHTYLLINLSIFSLFRFFCRQFIYTSSEEEGAKENSAKIFFILPSSVVLANYSHMRKKKARRLFNVIFASFLLSALICTI